MDFKFFKSGMMLGKLPATLITQLSLIEQLGGSMQYFMLSKIICVNYELHNFGVFSRTFGVCKIITAVVTSVAWLFKHPVLEGQLGKFCLRPQIHSPNRLGEYSYTLKTYVMICHDMSCACTLKVRSKSPFRPME